ncbi:hypothetical protein P3S68_020438 [Capsicum galapagoense]
MNIASDEEIERLSVDVHSDYSRLLPSNLIDIIVDARRRRRKEDKIFIVESMSLASTDSHVIIGKLVLFSKTLPSKCEDWETGTKALLDKESLISGGTIGSVYRTYFEVGVSIAVKNILKTVLNKRILVTICI